MFSKIKDFNEKNTAIYFFISIIILIGFLFFNSFSNKEKKNTCVLPVDTVNKRESYNYDIKINKNNEVVLLSIKKYNNKYLIEKTEKGLVYNYYIHYFNIYIKDETGNYNFFKDTYFVDGVDNKLLFIDYINDLSLVSKESVSDDKTCYTKTNESYNICIDSDNVLTYKENNITLTYRINNSSEVEDFEVNVNDIIDTNTNNLDNTNNKVNENN